MQYQLPVSFRRCVIVSNRQTFAFRTPRCHSVRPLWAPPRRKLPTRRRTRRQHAQFSWNSWEDGHRDKARIRGSGISTCSHPIMIFFFSSASLEPEYSSGASSARWRHRVQRRINKVHYLLKKRKKEKTYSQRQREAVNPTHEMLMLLMFSRSIICRNPTAGVSPSRYGILGFLAPLKE